MMKFLTLLFFLPYLALATTRTATTCAQADVQTQLALSISGDTVQVPSGSATWGTTSALSIPAGVTVTCDQGGTTTITLASGYTYGTGVIQPGAGSSFGYCTINENSSNSTAFSTAYNGFRITHIAYTQGSTGPYFAYCGSYGVIDNCNITGGSGSAELIFARGPSSAWQTADSLGSANAVYVEACTFNGEGYVCDFNSDALGVVRFCTINSQCKIDAHGFASDSGRGVRQMEVYGNQWNAAGSYYTGIEMRGGKVMEFNNTTVNPQVGGNGAIWQEWHDYGTSGYWSNYNIAILTSTGSGVGAIITTATPHKLPTGTNIGPIQVTRSAASLAGTYLVNVTSATQFTIASSVNPSGGAGGQSDSTVLYVQTPSQYFMQDQIGLGEDVIGLYSGTSAPMYAWGNTQGTSGGGTNLWPRTVGTASNFIAADGVALYQSEIGNPSYSFTDNDIVKQERDVFTDLDNAGSGGSFDGTAGVGVGTTAQMNALTSSMISIGITKPVGFWVTDQGSWNTNLPANSSGELFVWNGIAWVLKYTPYTYPFYSQGPQPAPSNLSISSP